MQQQDTPAKTAIVDAKALLANLELPYLIELQAELARHIEARKVEEIYSAVAEIQRIAASVGLKPEEIINMRPNAHRAGEKPPAKFANPSNPSETWSGLGRQPQWYRAAIQAGTTASDLLINPPS